MANLVSKAVKQHHSALAKAAGVEVVYTHEGESIEITIVALGKTVLQDTVEDEIFTSQPWDFGIGADDLIFLNGKIEPAIGDEITTGGKTYRVSPINGPRCFEPMDPVGVLYRVHTVEVEPGE